MGIDVLAGDSYSPNSILNTAIFPLNNKQRRLPAIVLPKIQDTDEKLITDDFVSSYANRKVPFGYNGLGYIVYKRTYAREKENGQTEEWHETLQRCINGAQKIGADYTKTEAERLYDYMFNMKCLFGGRMLWQLGTSTVDRFGLASLLNCWWVSMRELEDFCFVFEHLMLGGGVGFSVKREDIHELPKIKEGVKVVNKDTKDATFICPDSREGWVELLRKVLHAFYVDGKSFSYSTILVRGEGAKIKGFGGVASGPQILVDGINNIVKIFQSRESKKLRSIDVLDVCNLIGSIVVSGNVRRSAEIAIGDPDDYLFLKAKRWDLGEIPNWRRMSNNSIFADDFTHISNQVWEGYIGNGEPHGLINLPLSRKYGRVGEERKDNCEGVNPCGEISLADGEACCLSELFLNNIKSKDELIDCAKLLYKTQKAIWTLPAFYEKTTKVSKKNMRIGIGIGGICQAKEKLDWLNDCYTAVRKFDSKWSKQKGYPESIKISTVKPSGTISLLAGATPGIHPAFDEYYIRRVTMSANDPLVTVCEKAGYKIDFVKNQDGSDVAGSVAVEFPCKSSNATLAKDVTAVEQLQLLSQLQKQWSDNSVSATIYYKKEELPDIKAWLKDHYRKEIKSVSFLLHQDHGFKNAPYESILEDTYNRLVGNIRPIEVVGNQQLEGLECAGGVCPIK
jgi:ribonucleoside-triphosphate reductase